MSFIKTLRYRVRQVIDTNGVKGLVKMFLRMGRDDHPELPAERKPSGDGSPPYAYEEKPLPVHKIVDELQTKYRSMRMCIITNKLPAGGFHKLCQDIHLLEQTANSLGLTWAADPDQFIDSNGQPYQKAIERIGLRGRWQNTPWNGEGNHSNPIRQ